MSDEPMPAGVTSPALRLLSIYERARGLPHESTTLDAWRMILAAPDMPTALERVAMLQRLFSTVVGQLETQKRRSAPTYVTALNALREVSLTPQRLNAPWSDTLRSIQEHNMMALTAAADLLEDEYGEAEIPIEIIERLHAEIDDLFEAVAASNEISLELRDVLLRHLDGARRAIEDYPLVGAARLREVANEGIAEAFLHQVELSSLTARKSQVGLKWTHFVRELFMAARPNGEMTIKALASGATEGALNFLAAKVLGPGAQ